MNKLTIIATSIALCAGFTACSDNEDTPEEIKHTVTVTNSFPEGFADENPSFGSASLTFTELNTRNQYNFSISENEENFNIALPSGTYDYTGEILYSVDLADGTEKNLMLRTVGSSVTITGDTAIALEWFKSNPTSSLLISEIYAAGSLNVAGTNGLRDSFIRIYNNSDATLYADGLAIVESDFVNARASDFTITTPANDRNINFTVGTIWVIPGNGTDVPVNPGEYITLTDQAINWSAEVPGALDLTVADFEWYNDHAQDTDNPDVPNLDLWYCYSNTIWIMSNQCNRSYALVKFPDGMTKDKYLAEYHGGYDYIHPATGKEMHKDKAYLIPNEWILDGVNLSNREVYVRGALATSIDASYASISDKNSDKQRFGKKFVRKVAATTADGREILQDTDDSASDFLLTPAK